jgi:HD-GYP domain-containing protein (c-di-GMP phosphodiesterase class II)
MMYYSATGLMEDVMADPRAGGVVPRSRGFVEQTCAFLVRENKAFRHLLNLTSTDYFTYTHSVNVFVFSVALGKRIGMDDARELRELGEGALLHDLGKSMIDPEILNCPGKLNSDQWEEIKRHPVLGHEILVSQGMSSRLALSAVRHHHEKLHGSGYPDGLGKDDISLHARICAIADIFDALTTKRCYKGAVRSYRALEMMCHEMRRDLDRDLLRVFVEMMGNPEESQAAAENS